MANNGILIDRHAELQSCSDISSFCKIIHEINGFGTKIKKEDSVYSNIEIESNLKYGVKVIITIPAYNEEDTIVNVISRIKDSMNQTKYCYNYIILVVNDGSTDRTAEVASKAGAFVYSHKENFGLANTFRTEMKLCCELGGDIIVHTDADGQYNSNQIISLIQQIENGYDLVLGSRFKGTIEYMPGVKKFGNKAFSLLITLLTKHKITDGQTGFRAFTNKIAKEIQITSTHTYTQEQIIRAAQCNYSIKEIPISFTKRNNGKSRLIRSPIEYAIRAWKDIIRIYLRNKFDKIL